jgi:hypothetical protein
MKETDMTTYEPRQTRQWSTRELYALIGKRVVVHIDGIEVSGVVVHAAVGPGGSPFIEWEGGGGITWHRERNEATVTVADSDETGEPR